MTRGRPPSLLQQRLDEFFAANPDEELLYSDVRRKFDCTQKQAENAIQRLKAKGSIECVHLVRLRAKGIAR
jgi:hypothetical protein